VSWALWDWPLTWLTNHHPSVLWHCWLGHLTRKIVPKMTYNVSSVTLNTTIPYCTISHTRPLPRWRQQRSPKDWPDCPQDQTLLTLRVCYTECDQSVIGQLRSVDNCCISVCLCTDQSYLYVEINSGVLKLDMVGGICHYRFNKSLLTLVQTNFQ